MARAEIVGVQYLRGYAASAVVLYHASAMAALPKYYGQHILGARLEPGDLGVNLFFLISGFIITAVSLDRDLHPRIQLRNFCAKRFVRIVPLMWIAILVFVVLRLARDVWHPVEYMRALTLWPWGDLEPGHIWTLRQELVFYAVFAVSMLGGRRWLLAVWLVAPALLWFFGIDQQAGILDPVWLLFSPHNFEFAAGMGVAALWLKGACPTIRLPIDPAIALLLMSATLFYLVIPATGMELGAGVALIFAPLLLLAVFAETRQGVVHSVGELLGNASYAIYLFHPPIVAAGLGASRSMGLPLWSAVIAITIASIGGGVALHFALEKPLLKMLRRAPAKRAGRARA